MSESDPVVDHPDPNLAAIDAARWAVRNPLPSPPPPPTSCTRLGLKRAFDELGQWPSVKAAIAADPDVQEEWDLATSLSLSDPLVQGVIAVLGLSESEVDHLLARAHALVA